MFTYTIIGVVPEMYLKGRVFLKYVNKKLKNKYNWHVLTQSV